MKALYVEKSMYGAFLICKKNSEKNLSKHRKYRYNFIIYKLYRENLIWKVEDSYEQQYFFTIKWREERY